MNDRRRVTFIGETGFMACADIDAEPTDTGWRVTITGADGLVVLDLDPAQFAAFTSALRRMAGDWTEP